MEQPTLFYCFLAFFGAPLGQLLEKQFGKSTTRLAIRGRLTGYLAETFRGSIRNEAIDSLLAAVVPGKDLAYEEPNGDHGVVDAVTEFVSQLVADALYIGTRLYAMQHKGRNVIEFVLNIALQITILTGHGKPLL